MAAARNSARSQTKKPRRSPIGSAEAVAQSITEIGRLERRLDRISEVIKGRVARIEKKYADEVAAKSKELKRELDRLSDYFGENRDLYFVPGGSKTVQFPTGTVSFHDNPPATKFAVKEAVLIATLKELGLLQYIDTVETVSKSALLRDRKVEPLRPVVESIPGLLFTRDEQFVVVPTKHKREAKKSRTTVLNPPPKPEKKPRSKKAAKVA